ncbi:MAG: hypothetical protein GQ538_09440 [Xanthomonadales bacterium]|nr:hypothetical protein [Xanthomonadales bacterium]
MACKLKKGKLMKKLTVIVASMLLVASCSQLKTNKSELATLKTTADNFADAYVGCVVNVSLKNTSKNAIDVATAVQLAGAVCQTELDQFSGSQEEYLSAQFMLTEKPLQESVDTLNERATTEVGEALLAAADNQPAVAAPVVVGSAAAATPSSAAIPSAAAPTNGWNAEQRIYLDCMEDQGRKYSGLNESTTVIADVAQSRCKSYMAGPGSAALEQEGRTLVMGMVLDAKLQGPGR